MTRISKVPIAGKRNILITSALPYSNATPHLGNLIGCVLSADVYSRFTKQRGYNSLFICGTDEYGTATEFKALQENCTPKQICDKYFQIHKSIYEWFNIEFDYFGRTATPWQTRITTDIFKSLYSQGYILPRTISQHFCYKCDKFLADRFIEGICPICKLSDARGDQCDACGEIYEASELIEPKCKQCSTPTSEKDSDHFFLALSSIKESLGVWLRGVIERENWSANAEAISLSWLEKLEDRCITRCLKWGTHVPLEGYEDKVFYVWFDAPIGYLSITANAIGEDWTKWWKNPKEVELTQFMGKDNIPFHTIMFPSTLLGTKSTYTLLSKLSTTEYLLYQGGKFSKSNNRGVFGDDAISTGIPPSIWRYYLLINRPETSDTDFNWTDFGVKANTDLNNNLGNLIHRTLTFIKSKFNSKVPSIPTINSTLLQEKETNFITTINSTYKEYLKDLENTKLKSALRKTIKIAHLSNAYYQSKKPWATINSNEINNDCDLSINICFQICWLLSGIIRPFMPSISDSIQEQINTKIFPLTNNHFEISDKFNGHEINTPKVLFSKLEPSKLLKLKEKFEGKTDLNVFPIDLIVGTVVSIEDHAKAENLWIIKLRYRGEDKLIQIVSNLRKNNGINKSALLGRKVVFLNNIKKCKLQGESSYGMIVCVKVINRNSNSQEGRNKGGNGDDSYCIPFVIEDERIGEGERIKADSEKRKTVVKKNFNYKKRWNDLKLEIDLVSGRWMSDGVPLLSSGSNCLVETTKKELFGLKLV